MKEKSKKRKGTGTGRNKREGKRIKNGSRRERRNRRKERRSKKKNESKDEVTHTEIAVPEIEPTAPEAEYVFVQDPQDLLNSIEDEIELHGSEGRNYFSCRRERSAPVINRKSTTEYFNDCGNSWFQSEPRDERRENRHEAQ